MDYRQVIAVPQQALDIIYNYLNVEPQTYEQAQGEDNTIIYTADFGNGIQMDVKCCGVQWHPYTPEELSYGETNTSWSESVLFLNGSEVGCEYGENEFVGEWTVEFNGDTYTAVVVPA